MRKRVLVIGCRFVNGECRQQVLEGEIGFGVQRSGSIQTTTIFLPEPFDVEGFTGAPVLDEEGSVILVTKRSTLVTMRPSGLVVNETLNAEDFDHVISRW